MIHLNFNGKDYTIKDLIKITGLSRSAIIARLDTCKTFEELIAPKLEAKRRKYNIDGKQYSFKELCEITGCLPTAMRTRLRFWGECKRLLEPKMRNY